MKTIILTICLLQGIACFSQHFPFVTDPGSLAGSGGAAFLYSSIRRNDRNLEKEINNFNKKYVQRNVYLAGAAIIGTKIKNELNDTKERYQHLVSRNNSLVFFSYTKKRNNKKLLATIDQMISNIEKEVNTQTNINVLYGEKLNLFQNTMDSFTDIHRLMDIVEDKVEQSMLLDFLTRRR